MNTNRDKYCLNCNKPLVSGDSNGVCKECKEKSIKLFKATVPQTSLTINSMQQKMNIYDEAIELVITKVRARESGSIEKTKIIKALERAKKERKLLDVYREQSQAFFDEDFTKAIILQNDIDILEEKLEEMK